MDRAAAAVSLSGFEAAYGFCCSSVRGGKAARSAGFGARVESSRDS